MVVINVIYLSAVLTLQEEADNARSECLSTFREAVRPFLHLGYCSFCTFVWAKGHWDKLVMIKRDRGDGCPSLQ